MTKNLVKYFFSLWRLELKKADPFDKKANEIFEKYKDFTMIHKSIYIDNLKLINSFSHIDGCIVECGVWRGGMSAGIATLMPDREYFLFDSFEGLPEAKTIDGERALAWQKNTAGPTYYDNCKAEIEHAEKAMATTETVHHLVKGWFNETLPVTEIKNKIAVLRLDADWYESTMDCLVHLFPKVENGGIIIFDDYYTWDGCSKAVHDYLSKVSSLSRIHKTPYGVAFIIKKD